MVGEIQKPGSPWPASLIEMMSFKFNERTFLKAVSKMGKDIGRTTDVLLWPWHARRRVHACMCMHTVCMLFLMATS